jgi:uncharacterized protein (TIGR02270 family)
MSTVSIQAQPAPTTQTLFIKPLVLRHAEDAAFYWNQRNSKTHSPILRFNRLIHFDRVLKAHLDGLRIAGDIGWESALKNLQRWKGAGEAFVAYVLAIGAGDKLRLQALWEVVEKNPEVMQEGLISALGWVPEETAVQWMDYWLPLTNYPRLQQIALRAFAIRRLEPDVALDGFFASADAGVREAACILAGCAKLNQYAAQLQSARKDPAREVSEAAAVALLLLGRGAEVLQDLWKASLHWNEVANNSKGWTKTVATRRVEAAARYIGLALPPSHEGIHELMEKLPSRQALIVLAHHGDPATIPWIISAMARKGLARQAGWAFTMVTGVDLDAQRLTALPPASDDGADERLVPLHDPDVGLSWPHPASADAWWRENGKQYVGGMRLLLGRSASDPDHCIDVLDRGTQAERWAAAMNLAMHQTDYPLIATDARASVQRAQMAILFEAE